MDYIKDNLWNIKAIVKLFIPLVLILFILKIGPSLLLKYESSKYNAKTSGVVSGKKMTEGVRETYEGGFKTIEFYDIYFDYMIEDKLCKGNSGFQRSQLNLKQRQYLNNLKNGDSIIVKYQKENYNRSLMELK